MVSMNDDLKKHLHDSLVKGIRYDRRKMTEYRNIIVETGISKSAEGSARVKLGETEVLVGVKLSVGKPYPDTPDEGCLMVEAELSPMSSPEFESGPPGIEAIEIARVVDRGVREAKTVDMKKMCIEKGESVWFVSIDICTVNDAGNLLDASALAAVAALKDARFPVYKDNEINYREHTKEGLPLKKVPVAVTVFKIGEAFLVDPCVEEEKIYDAKLTVTSIKSGEICALQKGGESPLKIEDIEKMVDIAIDVGKQLQKHIN